MSKKRYNNKARQVVKTTIDNSETNAIKLDFAKTEYGQTEFNNALALPSKKRSTKIQTAKKETTGFLSKAQRKKLKKIVQKKEKKANRAALLESLSKVQASAGEVDQLTGISTMQTIGMRKLKTCNDVPALIQQVESDKLNHTKKITISSIKGANKKRRLLNMQSNEVKKRAKFDPNVVGLEENSCYETTSSEEEEDNKPVIIESTEKEVIIEQSEKFEETKQIVTEPKKLDSAQRIKVETNNDQKPKLQHVTINIEVKRDPKIQVARLKLPILSEEQRIMELINENEIVIIAGETGSGKTTQIPQFLYEAGYAEGKMIAVTQPRRVATVAMAARVGYELGLTKAEVSYLMRFEGNAGKDTRIKFMTDGVLLRELESDFLLSAYSVVIIDEAHERSVYTDILLGFLSRIVPLRRKRGSPLRLIIMSATLRIEDFTENPKLFKTLPPVINIESRQYPVNVHFNRRTPSDYMKEAFKKTVNIHTRLPEGGILVFVTGQDEVHYLVNKLKSTFPYKKDMNYSKAIKKKTSAEFDPALDSEPDDIDSDDDEVEKEMKRMCKARRKSKKKAKQLPTINLDDYDMPQDDSEAELAVSEDSDGHLDSDSDMEVDPLGPAIRNCRQPLWALPLYSMLDPKKQKKVFRPPPAGARLCVVSTDVAETSLTIPGIKYVVDAGKKKMRMYSHSTGASAFRVVWTSQASAEQRAGRAGRTGPGHVYRLYSSAVYQHDCPAQYPPDMRCRPIDDIVLTMKCLGIDRVINFPFPTAPDRIQLQSAERRLQVLRILEKAEWKNPKLGDEERLIVTRLGRFVTKFPVLPRYGKILALSRRQNLMHYSIAMVAALSVQELMTGKTASWPAEGQMLLLGDPGVLLRAVGAEEHSRAHADDRHFCTKHGIREKAITEVCKLRKQLTSKIEELAPESVAPYAELPPLSDDQARLMRQLLLCGHGDQVAKKIGLHEVKPGEDRRKFKYAYKCAELEDPVYLHSDSILRQVIPEWVIYQELYEAGPEGKRKMIMRNVAAVEPEWLPVYVPLLCHLSAPLSDPEPRYDATTGTVKARFNGTFGKDAWALPIIEIDYPDNIDKYRWFARFLLEGLVFPKLKPFVRKLLSPPSTMVKQWAKLQPRTETMLRALVKGQVGTEEALLEVWEKQPKFLLNEYLKWLPKPEHNALSITWPPLS